MPGDTKKQEQINDFENAALSRRNMLLGSSTLVAAAALTSGALAQAQKAAPAAPAARRRANSGACRRVRPQAQYSHHLGRRCRCCEHQCLLEWRDGL